MADRRNAYYGHGPARETSMPVKSAEVYEQGHMIAENSLGEAIMVTGAAGLKIIGLCLSHKFTGDPSDPQYSMVTVAHGLAKLEVDGGDAVTRAHERKIVYAKDSKTIAATSQGGTLSPCGIYWYSDDDGKPIVYVAPPEVIAVLSSAAALNVAQATIAFGALTNAVVGASQAVNVGAALPAGALVLGASLSGTAFSGGGHTALTVDIGSVGDVDAIIDGADLFAAFIDGAPSTSPAGIAPNKFFAASAQLLATFIPDPAEALAGFTAGSIKVLVPYMVVS